MGKMSYNDKLHMQTLWQVPTAWFRQNGWASVVDSTADFVNSAQLSPFVRVTGNDGFCTKSLLVKRLHAQFVFVKVKKEVDLYNTFIVVPHTQGAQVRITQCYLRITLYLPLPCKHSPDGASPDWGCTHIIAAYYSFIYPKRMKGWVGLVDWPTADGLPT